MANPYKIGLFFSDDKVVLVQSNRDKPEKIISLPVLPSADPKEDPAYSDINEEVQIVALFQKIFRDNKIEPGAVCVSVPTKEVFLRSFVIPFMPANEVSNVVFFEAKKYVPFELKLLDYSYKTIPFVEDKQKRLRVIFYGARKQTLEKYDRILKQLECKPLVYEPTLVSLAKQLIVKKHLKPDQKMVVVYVYENHGQIVFYEKGISYFFRDFPLTIGDVRDPRAAPDVVRVQLLREIRKSFEYYSRQFSKEKVKEILVISSILDKELVNSFAEELSVKAKIIDSMVTVGQHNFMDMETICATGACITNKAIGFNFLEAKASAAQAAKEPQKVMPWYVTELMNWNFSDLIPAIQASVVCALILGAGFVFSYLSIGELKKQDDSLMQRQGEWISKTSDDISKEIEKNNKTLSSYKKVMSSSNLSYLLVAITDALPEGVWLSNARVQNNLNGRAEINLNGSVYLPQNGADFKAVNEFLTRLKSSKVLSKIKFKIERMDRQKIDQYDTVVFTVIGN